MAASEQQQQLPIVIITVPHATCPPLVDNPRNAKIGHPCDIGAPHASAVLRDMLEATHKCSVAYRVGDVPRTTSDLNRPESHSREWRRNLCLELQSQNVVCLLDVHSFPKKEGTFGPLDLVVMHAAYPLKWHRELRAAITDAVPDVKAGNAEGSLENDILVDARMHGVPAVIVEFSESLSEDALRKICEAITDFVTKRFMVSSSSTSGVPLYVVTVPHATCPPKRDKKAWLHTGIHACDPYGSRGCALLRRAFVEIGRVVVTTESPVPRTDVDMNRVWSRTTGWRTDLSKMLAKAPDKIACLIDSHSYPADYPPWRGHDVVILTESAPETWQRQLATAAFLSGRGKNVIDITMTDIIQDAHSYGIPAVLIEFSEALSLGAMTLICERIADFLKDNYPLPRPKDRLRITTGTKPDSTGFVGHPKDELLEEKRGENKAPILLYYGQNMSGREKTVARTHAFALIEDAMIGLIKDIAKAQIALDNPTTSIAAALVDYDTMAAAQQPSVGEFAFERDVGTEDIDPETREPRRKTGATFDVESDWLYDMRHVLQNRIDGQLDVGMSIVDSLSAPHGMVAPFLILPPDSRTAAMVAEEQSEDVTILVLTSKLPGADRFLASLAKRCMRAEEDEATRRAVFSAIVCRIGLSSTFRLRKSQELEYKWRFNEIPYDEKSAYSDNVDVVCAVALRASYMATAQSFVADEAAAATMAIATIMLRYDNGLTILCGSGPFAGKEASKTYIAQRGVLDVCAILSDDVPHMIYDTSILAILERDFDRDRLITSVFGLRPSNNNKKKKSGVAYFRENRYQCDFHTERFVGFAYEDPVFRIPVSQSDKIVRRLEAVGARGLEHVATVFVNEKQETLLNYVAENSATLAGTVNMLLSHGLDPYVVVLLAIGAMVTHMKSDEYAADILRLAEHTSDLLVGYEEKSKKEPPTITNEEGIDWHRDFIIPESTLAKPEERPAGDEARKMYTRILGLGIEWCLQHYNYERETPQQQQLAISEWDTRLRNLLFAYGDARLKLRDELVDFSLAKHACALFDLGASKSALACVVLFGLADTREFSTVFAILRELIVAGLVPARVHPNCAKTFLMPILLDPELRSLELLSVFVRSLASPRALNLAVACVINVLWEHDLRYYPMRLDDPRVSGRVNVRMKYNSSPTKPREADQWANDMGETQYPAAQPLPEVEMTFDPEYLSREQAKETARENSRRRASSGFSTVNAISEVLDEELKVAPRTDPPMGGVEAANLYESASEYVARSVPTAPILDLDFTKEFKPELTFGGQVLGMLLKRCLELNEQNRSQVRCSVAVDAWKSRYAKRIRDNMGLTVPELSTWRRTAALGMALYGINDVAKTCATYNLLNFRDFHQVHADVPAPLTLATICLLWKTPVSKARSKFIDNYLAGVEERISSVRRAAEPSVAEDDVERFYGVAPRLLAMYGVKPFMAKEKRYIKKLVYELAAILLTEKVVKETTRIAAKK